MSARAERRWAAAMGLLRREAKKAFAEESIDLKTLSFGELDTEIEQQRREIEDREGEYLGTSLEFAVSKGDGLRLLRSGQARGALQISSHYAKAEKFFRLGKEFGDVVVADLPHDVCEELESNGEVRLFVDNED